MYNPDGVTVQRGIVWETDCAHVQRVQWLFEEDIDRLKWHDETYERCVPFSHKNSIMLESHYLAFADKRRGGRSKVIVTIEKDWDRQVSLTAHCEICVAWLETLLSEPYSTL